MRLPRFRAHRRPQHAPFQLFSQADLDFETLVVRGGAAYGFSEVGEVVTAVNGINAAAATYQAYYDQSRPWPSR